MSIEFDVIVVGGGAAGVGAARRLAEHGSSTLLLEANSRLGGRAWTHEVGGFPLDLGCAWLHSADRNAWVGVAEGTGFAVDRGEPRGASRAPARSTRKANSGRRGRPSTTGTSDSVTSIKRATERAMPWIPTVLGTATSEP